MNIDKWLREWLENGGTRTCCTIEIDGDGDLSHAADCVPTALAQALLRVRQALSGLLPLDGRGRCFRCNFQEPDEHKMHIDRDNLWDGDQPCLDHETYAEAREALADTELEEAL